LLNFGEKEAAGAGQGNQGEIKAKKAGKKVRFFGHQKRTATIPKAGRAWIKRGVHFNFLCMVFSR
jgi:hypothetical protein